MNARLHERTLTVAGRPVQFASDAAKELLRENSFGQRADLAADLTGMLTAIDAEQDFRLAAEKFRRSHAPQFELPREYRPDLDHEEATGRGDEPAGPASTAAPTGHERPEADALTDQGPTSGTLGGGESDLRGDTKAVDAQGQPVKPEHKESASMGGSYNRDRALAQQNALAEQLRSSLKGEIAPNREEDDAGETGISNEDGATALGDEDYREIAARYEREAGREPELGEPRQTGWDIRSTDPRTKAVRLIEVKGKGRLWDEDEVVELTRAQIGKAFATDKQATDSWYLYVVEKTDDGGYQVLPISNPVRVAAKWILLGKAWRMVAESPKSVAGPQD